MSVQDVVLFVSSTSQACIPVIQFIKQNQIPVKFVRLDTAEDREKVIRGDYFQIQAVPTLLVIYEDGNVQLFGGQDKIMAWFQQIMTEMSQPPQPVQQPRYSHEYPDQEFEEPKEIPVRRNKVKPPPKKKSSSKKTKKEPPKKKSKGLYDGKPKKKKKPVSFEEESSESEEQSETEDSSEEVEIEYFDEEPPMYPSSMPNQSSGLEVGPRSLGKRTPQMGSILDIAKKMEKERQASLGYKESDLPVQT